MAMQCMYCTNYTVLYCTVLYCAAGARHLRHVRAAAACGLAAAPRPRPRHPVLQVRVTLALSLVSTLSVINLRCCSFKKNVKTKMKTKVIEA